MSDEQAADLRVSYQAHVERFLHRDPGSLLVDKFPLNIVHVPLIVRLFPSARIILALRHPCDVVLSNFMQHYRVNTAMANFFTISDSVHCYQEVMGLWLTVADLLDFSQRSVRYESLVTDFDTEVGALIEFLGVGWDDAVNDYARHARERGIIDTPSYQDVTEPINRRALYRWERYSDELGTAVDSLAPFAEGFGYDTI